MRFHVVSLSTTQTTKEYLHCAYTQKVRKFCNMMTSLNHQVFLYASEQNEADCSELITCITRDQQRNYFGMEKPTDNLNTSAGSNRKKGLDLFLNNAIQGIKDRSQHGDTICIIGGSPHKPIADTFPSLKSVEFGIGYRTIFAKYKVFESYAWMHFVYGLKNIYHERQGKLFDTVIPNYYDVSEFPFSETKDDYFLFIGRLTDAKGYHIAVDVCKTLGKRLLIAGQGTPPDYGEYLGVIDTKKRGQLMSKAQAIFAPSLYVEPFGGVHAEAMLCGTPVITTDWGAFVENNIHGTTGFRCRTRNEFLEAAKAVASLKPKEIHDYAASRYSVDVVKHQYEAYFHQISAGDTDSYWQTLKQ